MFDRLIAFVTHYMSQLLQLLCLCAVSPVKVPVFRSRASMPGPWLIWGGRMQCEAAIYVGGCDDALQWAARCAHSIVNCANIDYPWAQHCSRRWLNLKYRGSLNGRTWEQRMRSVTEFCLNALVNNEVLLLHCRVGRHRSGAFCSFLLAFITAVPNVRFPYTRLR